MQAFTFNPIPSRVIFGQKSLVQVGDEIARLGHSKALVLSSKFQTDDALALAKQLGPLCCGTFCAAEMHTPIDVTERALQQFQETGADCVVALGGGSTIGLGKAIAIRTGADQVVIPTTYAGSEMTDILGETVNGLKTTRRDPAIRPQTVIYDVDLTLGLPIDMTVTSSLNAIAHAIEALYAVDENPVLSLMSVEAIRVIKGSLPILMEQPRDIKARSDVLYGAWLCSTVLGHVSMALHHKLCHTLGGSFDTPHAETHAILLPHTAAFNAPVAKVALAPVADNLGGSVGGGLWDFAKQVNAPMSLRDLGLTESDLDRAAEIASKNKYPNPRAFERADIRAILQDAWSGSRPKNN